MSETGRKLEFRSEFTLELIQRGDRMLSRRYFPLRRKIEILFDVGYTVFCLVSCVQIWNSFQRLTWHIPALLLMLTAVLAARPLLRLRGKKIDRLRFEEAYPDGSRVVTWWVSGDRLYNNNRYQDEGIPLAKFTQLLAADGVAVLITLGRQMHLFERKVLSETDWSALAWEIKARNPKFKATFKK